jgi:hypothetical protein
MPTDLVYLAAVILLPLIPAFLLYKMLPSETWVDGPLKGLKIHLTGAFAAYFVLLLIIAPVVYGQTKPLRDRITALEADNAALRDQYQIWSVEINNTGVGRIADNPFNRLIHVVIRPPEAQPLEDGIVNFQLVVPRNASGQLEFPTLTFTYTSPNGDSAYEERSINLNQEPIGPEYTLRRDNAARKLTVVGQLSLKKRVMYQPQSAPVPVH